MLPYISLFGKTLPAYGVFAGAGILIAGVVALLREKKSPIGRHLSSIYLTELFVGAIGAKILYIITSVDSIRNMFGSNAPVRDVIFTILVSGFVFYGGLYGALLGAFLYGKINKLDFWDIIFDTLLLMPIFHAAGRIGCFMTGCCHGCETSLPIGIAYTCSEVAPNGVKLIPVQLAEVLVNIILLVWMAVYQKKHGKDRRACGRSMFTVYLFAYGIARFILEFFRGDNIRGFVGPLSTSQVISIITVAWGLYLLISKRKCLTADR